MSLSGPFMSWRYSCDTPVTAWMTELACHTTLLASISTIVSHASAYFGWAPPANGEGRVLDRRFWKGPPSTLGGVAGTLGDGGVSGWIMVGPLVMLRE